MDEFCPTFEQSTLVEATDSQRRKAFIREGQPLWVSNVLALDRLQLAVEFLLTDDLLRFGPSC